MSDSRRSFSRRGRLATSISAIRIVPAGNRPATRQVPAAAQAVIDREQRYLEVIRRPDFTFDMLQAAYDALVKR